MIQTFPHLFAWAISDQKWKKWPYLEEISYQVACAIRNGDGRLIVNMPPRHGKSEFISKWVPIWYLSNWPDKKIILTTYGAEYSATWGRKIRDEIRANELINTKIRQDYSGVSAFETTDGGTIYTAGIGGPVTGKGGDLIIIDDPVKNYDEAKSQTYQQKVIDWFDSTLYTRQQPNATIILLMTRWHENDLTGYLLKHHTDDWKHIRFPAIAEIDEKHRKRGEPLCPERYGHEILEKMRQAVGPIVWEGLYQQRPTNIGGGVIKKEWIKYYHQLPVMDTIIQSWDLTVKMTTDGSYVVGQVWGKAGNNIYLIDQTRKRLSYTETKTEIKKMAEMYPKTSVTLIEEKANGPAVLDDLRNDISSLVGVDAKESKETRAIRISPVFESGRVYIPENAPWVPDYVHELTSFPNAANDDQMDATSQALARLSTQSTSLQKINSFYGIGATYENELI